MKVTIDATLHFVGEKSSQPTAIEIVGADEEDLDDGMILLVAEEVSVELRASDLRRALRVFVP